MTLCGCYALVSETRGCDLVCGSWFSCFLLVQIGIFGYYVFFCIVFLVSGVFGFLVLFLLDGFGRLPMMGDLYDGRGSQSMTRSKSRATWAANS